jgi:hypothetical protein
VDVEIKLNQAEVEAVRIRLAHLPGQARFALNAAIRYALRRGRTQALRIAGERYQLGNQYSKAYRWALQAMGPVRLSGTTGFVHVSGARIPLMFFPHVQTSQGTSVNEMVAGEPIIQRHTFGKNVWHRLGSKAPRYPIQRAVGLATAEMVGQKSDVKPKLETSIGADLYKELHRLMAVALSGGFTTPK